jgi:hypothetical protein
MIKETKTEPEPQTLDEGAKSLPLRQLDEATEEDLNELCDEAIKLHFLTASAEELTRIKCYLVSVWELGRLRGYSEGFMEGHQRGWDKAITCLDRHRVVFYPTYGTH